MRRPAFLSICITISLGVFLSAATAARASTDLYFGEALFYAHQDEYFDAISRLDAELGQYYSLDEPGLDSLHLYIDNAQFSVGDFELYYRMHQRAGRAIKAVIEGNVEPAVRNEAIYRLAKILLQKNQPVNALHAIDKIKGKVPDRVRDDIAYMRALIYMVNGRPTDAVKIFSGLQGSKTHGGFAAYNMGIALLQLGKDAEGIVQLARAGTSSGSDEGTKSIRDKANLALGYKLLETGEPEQAKKYLDRVRLNGPFSNRALLGSGWADIALKRYDRALVPWTILSKRNVTDRAVQEVMLGVPFAYGKYGLHGKSAVLYGHALESFDKELTKLDSSIKSIQEGKFLKALAREELKQDRNWVVKLRNLPDAPETHYLIHLMASHDFQESLQNYFDLEEIRKRLIKWEVDIGSYQDLVKARRAYYTPLLPVIEKKFQLLDSRMRLRVEQRDNLENKLQAMLIAPRPQFLATVSERIYGRRVALMERRVKHLGIDSEPRQRVDRLRGALNWNINSGYHDRLTNAFKRLRQLDGVVADLKQTYRSFVRTRQAATQSYEGYDDTLNTMRIKVLEAQERVKTVMLRQGHMLETMAVNELDLRRKRIEGDQVKARFALAESYDRAQKAQTDSKFKKLAEKNAEEARKVAEQVERQAAKEKEEARKQEIKKEDAKQ
ncbi:MAG: tetratricopeptide repeat protein [Proteobacteria bacterium]|nr:tetratricopeptide repeat protein [Pseudomonadota bacterium]